MLKVGQMDGKRHPASPWSGAKGSRGLYEDQWGNDLLLSQDQSHS